MFQDIINRISSGHPCVSSPLIGLFLRLLVLTQIIFVHPLAAHGADPWAVENWARLPEWLKISGQTRARYESIDRLFRPGVSGSDQAWVFRNLIQADLNLKPISFTGEILDARQVGMDGGSPIGTDDVNTLEVLQAFVHWKSGLTIDDQPVFQIKAGRQTLNLGSRRLIARNRFRNTINAFNGIHAEWNPARRWNSQAFVFVPQQREPSDVESLLDNEIQLDRENLNVWIPGVAVRFSEGRWNTEMEGYVIGVIEEDSSQYMTRNRRQGTGGVRWFRAPSTGKFDFEIETILQAGTSRATAARSDRSDLNHLAYMLHFHGGYTLNLSWTPRIALHYDEASGDRDPNDNSNNRFDTLYGARRFEFGPSGILGAFARSNIRSPGVRMQLRPLRNVSFTTTGRYYWLASSRDSWTATGWRNASGTSGRDIGAQLEWSLSWKPLNNSLQIQTGGAQHWFGDYLQHMNPSGPRRSYYQFFQVSANF